MKSRYTTIEFPVFCDYVVHVEVTSNLNKAMKKYPQTKNIDEKENIDAVTVHVHDEAFSFIFLKPNSSIGTITHECWHVVQRILEYIGAELENEIVAYHLGYMVNKVFRFVRGRIRGKK